MPKLTMEERKRRFDEYQRNRTPEDIRIEALEDEDDERFIASIDLDEPVLPIEELWKALGIASGDDFNVNHSGPPAQNGTRNSQ